MTLAGYKKRTKQETAKRAIEEPIIYSQRGIHHVQVEKAYLWIFSPLKPSNLPQVTSLYLQMSWLLSPKDLAPSLSKHRRPKLTIPGIDQILLIYAYCETWLPWPAWVSCVQKRISLHLPRFQVIEIESLSIRKNVTFYHQSGIDVEEKNLVTCKKPRFRGRRVWKQISVTKADLFLRILEAIPGTLRHFETL